MFVELINTGNELMLGRVLNTHQQWICSQLADAGYTVTRQIAVSDRADEIQAAVREALCRADLVITTGGLGPTSDDCTRDAIARLIDRPLREDAAVLKQGASFFALRNRPMPSITRVEAQVPEGATVFINRHGTAPGLAMEIPDGKFRQSGRPTWLIMRPGPPRELKPMFSEDALPWIRRVLPLKETLVCRTVRTNGIGESVVQERITPLMQSFVKRGLELGYCARPGQVDVRFVARGGDAVALVEDAITAFRAELEEFIYGADDDLIEQVVVGLLRSQGKTLAVAESCTGGRIANRVTNVPGASEIFNGGFVTYSNEMKVDSLGVNPSSIAQHGAVSEAVAREMAEGARVRARSDYALSVTGIAGPGGGSVEKPVGTVYIGIASANATDAVKFFNPWDRLTFKEVTAQQALNLLRKHLLHEASV